jgi:hypothetical protein
VSGRDQKDDLEGHACDRQQGEAVLRRQEVEVSA